MKKLIPLLMISALLGQGRNFEVEAITHFYDADVDSTLQAMNSSDGVLYSVLVSNPNGIAIDLRFYDTPADTVATGETPDFSFRVRAPDSSQVSIPLGPHGVHFIDGIKYGAFRADGTDPATGLILNAVYRDN